MKALKEKCEELNQYLNNPDEYRGISNSNTNLSLKKYAKKKLVINPTQISIS